MRSGRQWGSELPMLTALDFSTDWGIEPSCWAQVLIEAFALKWASTIIVLKKSIRNRDFVCVLKHKIQSTFKVQRTLCYYFKNILTPPSCAVCLSEVRINFCDVATWALEVRRLSPVSAPTFLACLRQGLLAVPCCACWNSWHESFWGFSCPCIHFTMGEPALQMHATLSGFTWVLGIQTKVFMLVRTLPTSHLLSTKNIF